MRAAVHVGQLLQPVPGGIGRYVRHLVASLPGAGVEVTTFATGTPDRSAPGHVDLGWPRGSLRYELWHRLRRPVVHVPGDVLHATSLAVPPPGRRPLVVTVHDLVFLRQPEHLTPRGVSFHRRGLELTRRDAAVIVVPTEFGKVDLVREGIEPERILVAHHGVECGPPGDAGPVLGGLGLAGQPFLLFVSTIEPRKGVADVLAAHAALRTRHPDLGLVLAGRAGWGTPPSLDGPGVRWLGEVDDTTLDALYRSAVALVHPARYEGFGMTPLEALARGCPVVVSDAACLPEIVGDAGLVVPTGEVGALVDALGPLVDGGATREALVAAGPRRAAAFTWAASAAAHARAYAAAVEASS
jgi:glycosyltransferase involved in cell wall biosynthesis